MMLRAHDWPTRLLNQVEQARRTPFAWGASDCCLFACDCVQAMTGVDPAAWFRGRYTTRRGAMRALKSFAGGGLEAAAVHIAAGLNAPEVPPAQAQRGDVVLLSVPSCPPENLALGICLGGHHAAQGPQGISTIPLAQAVRAWRV